MAEEFLLLLLGEVFEVVRESAFDLLLAVLLWVLKDLAALVPHPLQAATNGVDAGSEATLEHRHGESQRPCLRRVTGRSLDGLVLHVPGECIVEVVLLAVEVEPGGAYVPVGEELAGDAVLVREADQGFLRATEVEGGLVPVHGLLEAAHVAVDISVQEGEEESEVLGVALVRGGRHQQVVVGALRERFA